MSPTSPEARSELLVCTISREGTPVMNALVTRTMEALAEAGHRVAAVHLEAGDDALTRRVRAVAEIAHVHPAPGGWSPLARANAVSARLLAGVRELAGAVAGGAARAMVYLEGDKHDFVPHIAALAEPVLAGRVDLNVATRSAAGMARFPWVQRVVESAFDRYVAARTGVRIDCLYGPRAYSAAAAARFAEYRADDWGVVVYPMVWLLATDGAWSTLEVPGAPPPDYMAKYDPLMRPAPAHLLWRLIQNRGNWRAARTAFERAGRRGLV